MFQDCNRTTFQLLEQLFPLLGLEEVHCGMGVTCGKPAVVRPCSGSEKFSKGTPQREPDYQDDSDQTYQTDTVPKPQLGSSSVLQAQETPIVRGEGPPPPEFQCVDLSEKQYEARQAGMCC